MLFSLALLMVGILVFAAMTWYLRPTRNVDRGTFSHWFKSLMRLYRDGALIQVIHLDSEVELEVLRDGGEAPSCHLLIRVGQNALSNRHKLELEHVALFHEHVSLEGGLARDEQEPRLAFRVVVPDIWEPTAADIPAQVVHRLLDNLGVTTHARFKLVFRGERSLELTREVQRRQKSGMLVNW